MEPHGRRVKDEKYWDPITRGYDSLAVRWKKWVSFVYIYIQRVCVSLSLFLSLCECIISFIETLCISVPLARPVLSRPKKKSGGVCISVT